MGTHTLGQLLSGKQPVGFHHGALAMHPLGFNGVEPGTFGGQKEGQNAYAFAPLLNLIVVLANPGTHYLAHMKGGVIPDEQPGGL